jgi:ABC-type branched-subunit amino acid transport system ATPase component/branched-subunit amino acid ABC-type transport system permease component
MSKFLSLALSGAVTGAIYSLVAAGLTLSYTSTGIFNFSYGAAAFVCAYVFYELHSGLHWAIVPAAAVTILVFAPLMGLVLDAAVFRPLGRATESAKIMATVGLLIALPALTRFVLDELVNVFGFGIPSGQEVSQVGFPAGIGPVPKKDWTLPGKVPLDSNQLIVFVAAAVCALGLWFLLRRTSLGLHMRAVVDRPDLARTRGIDERTTSRWAWVIGMVLAGLAGVVGSPILGSLDVNVFITIVFVASAAAVIGGLRSIPLAFAGGLILGVAQNLVFGYATFASDIRGFNSSVPFVVLLGGLVLLARDRARRGGSAAEDTPAPDFADDLPAWRRALPWVIATLGLLVYIVVLADDFWISTIATGLALALVFLSFTIVTGLGGMVSLAQAGFVSAAALTAGMFIGRYHWPFVPALIAGAVVATIVGVAVALPALRLGGVPLALATLALAFLGDQLLFAWNWLRNDEAGWSIARPVLGPLDLNDNKALAITLLVMVGLTILLVHNLQRSLSGRAVVAVRASETAAATSGVSPVRTKLAVFALSAAVAGVGGVMLATTQGSVSNVSTPAIIGLLWLASVVLMGIRRPGAAVVAGITTAASPVLLRSGFHWPLLPTFLDWGGTKSSDIPAILFGLGAVQLARNPDGVFAITSAQNRARRQKRAARSAVEVAIVAEEQATAQEAARLEQELESLGALRSPASTFEEVPADAALVLQDVHAGYGDVEVLRGVTLAIAPGTITALLGANGSGKSTLCRTASGLITPTAGVVRLRGEDVTGQLAPARARADVIVVPESRGIFPGLSVDENLTLRLPTADERSQAYDRFPVLGERRHLPAGSLSGGEQQMLALATLLVRPPAVVVCDEPTLGLAPLIVEQIMEIFTELRRQGVALLLVEEKSKAILGIADRVAVLQLGRLAWYGPANDVDDALLVEAYLGGVTAG